MARRPLRAEVHRRLIVLRADVVEVSPRLGETVLYRLVATESDLTRPAHLGLPARASVEGLNLLLALLWPTGGHESDPPQDSDE